MMLPGKYGNRSITKGEKLGILGGQVALWGTAGVGMSEGYKAARDAFGLEPNPVVDAVIQGGIAENAINVLVRQITDDDTDLSIANTYAAGSGLQNSVYDLGKRFLEAGKSPSEFILGPSAGAITRFTDVMAAVNYAYTRPDLSQPEALMEAIKSFATVSSGVRNAVKIQMYKNLKAHVDKSGDPIMEATFTEAVAAATLGLQSKDLEDYYRVLNSKGSKAYATVVDEEASRLYAYWKNTLLSEVESRAELGANATLDEQRNFMVIELLKNNDTMMKHAMAMYDEDLALAVQESIRKKILAEEMELQQDSFYAKMVNAAMNGSSGNPMNDVITKIENSRLSREEKDQYIQLLQESVQGVEMLKEVNNNG